MARAMPASQKVDAVHCVAEACNTDTWRAVSPLLRLNVDRRRKHVISKYAYICRLVD